MINWYQNIFGKDDEVRRLLLLRDTRTIIIIIKIILIIFDEVGVRLLCPTRWNERAKAVDAVIKSYHRQSDTSDYTVLSEINASTHDLYTR